jgi:putative ABC transport system substrate-binding protein
MNRREFVTALSSAVVAWPLAARAQHAGKVWRIGVIAGANAATKPDLAYIWNAFIEGLREHGYVEGQNVIFERRYSEGRADRWPELASDLVRLKVDLILASTTPAALAAKNATSSIPIVLAGAIDPVGAGLATSLARPGGNVTGPATYFPELGAKAMLLLKEAQPGLSRVAVLWNPANPANVSVWKETENAARASGLTLHSVPIGDLKEFENISGAVAEARADGLLVFGDDFILLKRELIADLMLQKRLVAVTPYRDMTKLGALISYGVDFADIYHKAASYVDRILKGANPADLPFEQPTKFELVINLKTAKALGLTIPPTLLVRANEVIE